MKISVIVVTCRGCGWLLTTHLRETDSEEIDVEGKACNTGFTGLLGPHCAAAAQLPLPFLWSVRTNQELKDAAGRTVSLRRQVRR